MSSFVAPAPAVLTPEEVSGVLRDLTQAVQEIHLFLAGSYGPHPAAPPIAATAPPWLSWQPPHQAAFAALAGSHSVVPPWLPWQPLHQAASAALAGPLQLPSTAPPWLQWQPPLLAASAAPGAPPQQPLPLPGAAPQQPLQLQQPPPVSSGPVSTAPAGVPIHQIKFPPSPSPLPQGVPIQQIKFSSSPSPLPAWITARHVSAAVRLQAAARSLLARRHVREMRGLRARHEPFRPHFQIQRQGSRRGVREGCASTTQKSAIVQRKMSTSVRTQKDHKFGGRKRSSIRLVHAGR